MSGKALVISHSEDVDGLVSATLLSLVLERYYRRLEFWFFSYKNFYKELERLAREGVFEEMRRSLGVIFIADLAYRPSLEPIMSQLADIAEVNWIDHHPGTIVASDYLESLGVKLVLPQKPEKLCASKLIFRKWLSDDLRAYGLSRLAQASDYPETLDDFLEVKGFVYDLQTVIGHITYRDENMRSLMAALERSPDILNDSFFKEILCEARQVSRKATFEMLESIRKVKITKDKKFLLARGHPVLSSKETMRWLKNRYRNDGFAGFLVAFGSGDEVKVFVYDGYESDFDGTSFAAFMGGGGRDGGGAFNLDMFAKVGEPLDFVATALEKYFRQQAV